MALSFGLGVLSQQTSSTAAGQQVTVFTGSILDKFGVSLGEPSLQVQITPAQVDQSMVVVSQDSVPAYHSTLFEDFRLRAEAVYNYYTEDERVSIDVDVSASLDKIPRYVWLKWNKAPIWRINLVTSKGMRPPAVRTDTVAAVLPVRDAKVSVSNGYVSPGVVQALLVPPLTNKSAPRFDQDLFLSSPSAAGMSAVEQRETNTTFQVTSIDEPATRTRVRTAATSRTGESALIDRSRARRRPLTPRPQ